MSTETQTWRVVTADGATKTVVVRRVGLMQWVAEGCDASHWRRSQRDAIVDRWSDIVEIRAPGEPTTQEQLEALRTRCADVAQLLSATPAESNFRNDVTNAIRAVKL